MFALKQYFKDVNLIIFDKIIHFFSPIPTFTLNFGCNWQQPIPCVGDFHSIQCCFATAFQALTNLIYIQFLSTCIYIVMMVTILWDYDDRFLGWDFPFSCLGHSAVFSFYVDVVFILVWKTWSSTEVSAKKEVLTLCYFFFQRRPIHQVNGSKEKKNIDFYHSPLVLVYAFHLAFMTLFNFTSMHVQVSVNMFSNRFVCCSKEKNVKTEGWDYRKMFFFCAFMTKHKL